MTNMKKLLISILIATSLIAGVVYASVQLGQSYDSLDPVAWYTFNATTTDEMGNYDGTNNGATRTQGLSGGGFQFNGTSDYIEITDTSAFAFNTGDFSINALVKRDLVARNHMITSKLDSNDDGWRFVITNGNLVVCSIDSIDISSVSEIDDLDWHFISCTIDRDGFGQIYIDGVKDGDPVAINSEVMAVVATTKIGRRGYDLAHFFEGTIDDLKFYDYALTPQQVKASYNSYSHEEIGQSFDILDPLIWSTLDVNGTDEQGNYDGTNNGAIRTQGRVGGAFAFDGDTSHYNYGDIAELNSVSEFTISMLFKQNVLNVADFLFYKNHSSVARLATQTTADGKIFVILRNGGSASGDFEYVSSVSAGEYNHLLIVYDGNGNSNSDKLKVYLNSIDQTLNFTGEIPTTTSALLSGDDFLLGRDTTSLDGGIDDLKIYDYALSFQQVKQLFNSYGLN